MKDTSGNAKKLIFVTKPCAEIGYMGVVTWRFQERSGAGRDGGEVQERWRVEGDIFLLE